MRVEIKAVIFDFGGVLSLPPCPEVVRRMRERCGLSAEEFTRLYRELRPELDRGTLRAEEFWSRMIRAGDIPSSEALPRSLTAKDLASWTRPNRPAIRWARRLRAGGWRTAILSNMPGEFLPHIIRRSPWLRGLEPRVFSCEVGMIKPEPEIFRHCLDRLALEPGETLFLDDHEQNVAEAVRLGMHALHFSSIQTVACELRERFALPELLPAERAALKG